MFIHYIYISKKYWQKFFIYFFVSIISSLIIFSCQNNTTNNNEIFEKEIPNCYAKGFSIMKNKTYTKVSVINPWQGAQKISFDFFLVPKNSSMPETIKKNNVIRTPVSKIICLS